MSNDRRNAPLSDAHAGTAPLVEARFVPQRYEPNYAYPLLVLLHPRGGDEQQMVRSMPAMSWRNYVGLSLRGPEVVTRHGLPVGHGWGHRLRPSRSRPRRPGPDPLRRRTIPPPDDLRHARPDRRPGGWGLLGDPSNPGAPCTSIPNGSSWLAAARGGGRLPSRLDLSRALRRGRGDQRLATRQLPPVRPARSRRASCGCWWSTASGMAASRSITPDAPSPTSATPASRSRSSPTLAPTGSPRRCFPTSIPGS